MVVTVLFHFYFILFYFLRFLLLLLYSEEYSQTSQILKLYFIIVLVF